MKSSAKWFPGIYTAGFKRTQSQGHVTDDLGLGQSFHIYGVEWTDSLF